MIKVRNHTATRDGFREWLKAHPSNFVIGIRAKPCNCPLAAYITKALKLWPHGTNPAVLVTSSCVRVHPGRTSQESFTTPEWMRNFIHAVDYNKEGLDQITAGFALTLLHRSQQSA